MVDEKLIASIKRFHRDRCFMMDTRKIVDLRLGAHLRRVLGWRKDLPDSERKAIAAEAARMMKDSDGPYEKMILASHAAREIFAENEEAARKQMAKLAKQLPVWELFGKDVRGFGEVSLAVIVAEAGDLSNYASDAKLWKRFGLAPGQNRVPPNLSREARAQAWIDRGYNPRRRSHIWNVGDPLIKGNRDGKYRTLYLKRKEYEHARNPEMSDMHAHRRAQKYMEKRLLRDLWRAWRRASASVAERPKLAVPVAPIQQTKTYETEMSIPILSAERRAVAAMTEKSICHMPVAEYEGRQAIPALTEKPSIGLPAAPRSYPQEGYEMPQ